MEICYILPGLQKMCYYLHLSHNRTIEITVNIMGLKSSQLSTYCNDFFFRMHSVYVGELSPEWQLNLPFTFGIYERTLSVAADAISYFSPPINRVIGRWPTKEVTYYYPYLRVHISIEHIIIKVIPVQSSTTRLFTLRNVTRDTTIGFWFDRYYKRDVLGITVEPSTGILRPRELVTLVMRIRTFGTAIAIRACCTCYLINQSLLQEHIRSKTNYITKSNTYHDLFTVTSEGTEYASLDSEVVPPPKVFHRSIAVSCYSVSPDDIDLKMPMRHQMKCIPHKECDTYQKHRVETLVRRKVDNRDGTVHTWFTDSLEEQLFRKKIAEQSKTEECASKGLEISNCRYALIHIVLECVIRDVVFSNKVKSLMTTEECVPEYYYSQFINPEPEEERKITQLYMNQVPKNTLSETFIYMLNDSVLRYFHMGAVASPEELGNAMANYDNIPEDKYSEKFVFLFDSL